MGRKKRNLSYVKPFCYFCEKVFNNEIVLHQHQKSKHFTCPTCYKKFPTTSNLVTHMTRTHQGTIARVPNAIEGRDSPDLNIFGMTGVPKHVIRERMVYGAAKYWTQIQKGQKTGGINTIRIDPEKLLDKPKKEEPKSIRSFVKLNKDN